MFNVNYESAKVEVERLVERFDRLSARNRRGYNEPATRQEFILPLFRALGWNIEDTREVSPEERVSRGYVDFSFRLRGIPRFFVETKKIPEDLEDRRWARQAINYAWLKGVTWAVLTDFEGLKVFNAEWQETIPARAIFKDLYWDEYVDRFDDLWLLSRTAMEEGALDRAAEAVGKKAKKTPVSRQLFADLTGWRRELFRHLRPYNPMWSVEQIDEAVQRILDRLIFIRTCEDREIEPCRLRPMLRQWRDQKRKKDLVKELNLLFREFDRVYDTRLFAPHLCEELSSEPTPFEQIVEGLYEVPSGYGDYDFNAIDADVMGTIYEQYLGHRAQDPEGKQVVDKRAKRKAQGIYYTPQFVVRYIVGQTLGRLLEERDYEQARQVKVLDMACGSGSFLIEAFDVLDRYLAGVRGQNAASAAGDVHDFARRMEILTGNLYGVDLDAQAVEIARLNLLLKAVNQRGELPELTNIRQGNSLVSGTSEELEAAFGPDWRDKQPFDWEEQFPKIMEQGGFDVIVGNPPYGAKFTPEEKGYMKARYAYKLGKPESYIYFVEQGERLLGTGGYLGLIIPNAWLTNYYGRQLREYLLEKLDIVNVVNLEPVEVFAEAIVDTVILIARKRPLGSDTEDHHVAVSQGTPDGEIETKHKVAQRIWAEDDEMVFNLLVGPHDLAIMSQLEAQSIRLEEIADYSQGIIPYKTRKDSEGDPYISNEQPNQEWKLLLDSGSCVSRYSLIWNGKYIHYGEWLQRRRERRYFEEPKILFHRIRKKLSVQLVGTFDDKGYYNRHSLSNLILRGEAEYNLKYVLGLFNSRLLNYWFVHRFGLLMEVGGFKIGQLPIRRINFDDPEDMARHDRMVEMVEEMLRLQKEHAEAEALKEDRRHDLARRIEQLDAQIDGLVYELYGLTEEEIDVVERRGV
jgi:type I restriction-modification system DNA methylase subunit